MIGSRYLNGVSVVNWPLHRIFLSAFANRYVRAVTRSPPSDCTSGYRCWRRDALARLPLDAMVSNGYAFIVEMLFEASRRGCRIGEVPIIFVERRQGQSKVSGRVLAESLIVPWRLAAPPTRRPDASRHRHGDDVLPAVPWRQRRHVHGADREARLPPRGHDVHVVAPWHPLVQRGHRGARRPLSFLQIRADSSAERLRVCGGLARGRYACAAPHFSPLRSRSPQGWRTARRVARTNRATVMHGHWVIPGGVTAALAAPELPLVISLHGSDVFVAETLRAGSGGRAARVPPAGAVTACSEDLARRAIALGAEADRVEVVPYGVDADRFRPDPVVARRVRAASRCRRPSVRSCSPPARLVRKKGFEYLIDAMATLSRRVPAVLAIGRRGRPRARAARRAASAAGASHASWAT